MLNVDFQWKTWSCDVTLVKDSGGLISACSSFIRRKTNKISFVNVQRNKIFFEVEQSYPITKVMFGPAGRHNVMASSGYDLHIWRVENSAIAKHTTLSNRKNLVSPPIVSFDWSCVDSSLIGTCNFDTTCSVWNVETGQVKTQLIAHDKEVFDFAFSQTDASRFVSVGADGSLRLFDLRSLEHSSILWESTGNTPLMRVQWNPRDENFLSVLGHDGKRVFILDLRNLQQPVACVGSDFGVFAERSLSHAAKITAFSWSPVAANFLCTGDEDGNLLLWDLSKSSVTPEACKRLESTVSYLRWSSYVPDSLLVASDQNLSFVDF